MIPSFYICIRFIKTTTIMKKILLFTIALFVTMSLGAQEKVYSVVSLLKVNFEGVVPNYTPEEDNLTIVESTAEGLAITNPRPFDSRIWHSKMILTDENLTFQKKHNYLVRLTVKVPHMNNSNDRGAYVVEMGSRERHIGPEVVVYGGDDFQIIDVEVPNLAYNIEGDGYIALRTMWVPGITILKEIELFEIIQEGTEPDSPIKFEKDWSGLPEDQWGPLYVWTYTYPEDSPAEITNEGLVITNPTVQAQVWQPQTIVTDEAFTLEQNHDYIVRLTLKVPSEGTYQMNLGSWSTNYSCQVPVYPNDDFQTIDFEFPGFGDDIKEGYRVDDCHALLQVGWVAGATVVKKVVVFEKDKDAFMAAKETGIEEVKAMNTKKVDGSIYNLAGQKVSPSYKGIVIRNGKKVVQGRD